jgi:hypothetical protein
MQPRFLKIEDVSHKVWLLGYSLLQFDEIHIAVKYNTAQAYPLLSGGTGTNMSKASDYCNRDFSGFPQSFQITWTLP